MSERFVEKSGKPEAANYKTINVSLMSFAEKIYGKCPNCGQATVIKADCRYFSFPKDARVQCLNCTFYENWNAKRIYGKAIGKAKKVCPNCGTKWLSAVVRIDGGKLLKDHAEATCDVCGKTSRLSLSWQRAIYPSEPLDPFFSRPLWLQTECAGKILWVYNEEHLGYLKSYVEADLREDDGRLSWSMITRLPKWISAAKNRKDVLKAAMKIEAELKKINRK